MMNSVMGWEIIPNWHPVLVHFTIALLSVSTLLFVTGTLVRKEPLHSQLAIAARWNLWIGALAAMATVLAGAYAFSTVPHNSEAAHLAMIDHRAWALSTAAAFIALALWSLIAALCGTAKFEGPRHYIFVTLTVCASILLAITGYKGAELVYRHGLGVIPMQAMMGNAGHHHEEEEGGVIDNIMDGLTEGEEGEHHHEGMEEIHEHMDEMMDGEEHHHDHHDHK